jgi:hypothetical protein
MTGLFGWLAKRTANTGSLRDYPLHGSRGPVPPTSRHPAERLITRAYRLRATPPHMADRAAAGRAVGTVTAAGARFCRRCSRPGQSLGGAPGTTPPAWKLRAGSADRASPCRAGQLGGAPGTTPPAGSVAPGLPRGQPPGPVGLGRCAGNDTTCWKVGRFCQGCWAGRRCRAAGSRWRRTAAGQPGRGRVGILRPQATFFVPPFAVTRAW